MPILIWFTKGGNMKHTVTFRGLPIIYYHVDTPHRLPNTVEFTEHIKLCRFIPEDTQALADWLLDCAGGPHGDDFKDTKDLNLN